MAPTSSKLSARCRVRGLRKNLSEEYIILTYLNMYVCAHQRFTDYGGHVREIIELRYK